MNTDARKSKASGIVPAQHQPAQLELFRLVSDTAYSNAFDFYESIPRFIVARGNSSIATWNPDGTAAPVKREFTYQGKRYKLTLAPAYIDQQDGGLKAQFP